jgi:para-nitrobenzyl esterase
MPRTLKDGEEQGKKFLDFLGVKSIKEARQLDAFFIRDRYAAFAADNRRFGPVNDGVFNLGDPLRILMQNPEKMVPLMAGNTADEFMNSISAASEEDLKVKVKEMFGDKAEEFLRFEETLRTNKEGSYAPVSGLELTIKVLYEYCNEHGNANGNYYYRFDADIPGWDNPGTFHSVDLWFFFETLAKCWRPFVGRHYDLARQMCDYLCNFIKSGNPNGKDTDGSGLPEWSSYDAAKPCEMVFTSNGAEAKEVSGTGFETFIKKRILEKLR